MLISFSYGFCILSSYSYLEKQSKNGSDVEVSKRFFVGFFFGGGLNDFKGD